MEETSPRYLDRFVGGWAEMDKLHDDALYLFLFCSFFFLTNSPSLFVQFLLFVKYCRRRIALGSRILLLASIFACCVCPSVGR